MAEPVGLGASCVRGAPFERFAGSGRADGPERLARPAARVATRRAVGWTRGTDAGYLADLIAYWTDSSVWRAQEERIRALPWAHTAFDGFVARLIHQRAAYARGTGGISRSGGRSQTVETTSVLALHR